MSFYSSLCLDIIFFFFKQKTSYELRMSYGSSDVCSSDLLKFKPSRLYRLARSKAYLFAGVEIRWKCAPELITDDTPAEAVFQFPGGLSDHLREQIGTRECATANFFDGRQDFPDGAGRVEWAVAWPLWSDGSYSWYCNTIPTPDGGTHETGLRAALTKGIRALGEMAGQQRAAKIQAEIGRAHVR